MQGWKVGNSFIDEKSDHPFVAGKVCGVAIYIYVGFEDGNECVGRRLTD